MREILEKKFLKSIKNFHAYIMRNVVIQGKVDDDLTAVDFNSNGLLWTVLKEDNGYFRIDYEFLRSFSLPGSELNTSGMKKTSLCQSPNRFDDKVIQASHHATEKGFYYAKGIHNSIRVDDEFPNKNIAATYIDYYRKKYEIDLSAGQNMVEVVPVQMNLNLLECRYQEQGNTNRRQMILIPEELCTVHCIPGHLWQQIVAIPVIMHRLSSLLKVFDLQQIFMSELGLKKSDEIAALDANLDVAIQFIHTKKDCLGLQKIEKSCQSFNKEMKNVSDKADCSGNVHSPRKSSFCMKEESNGCNHGMCISKKEFELSSGDSYHKIWKHYADDVLNAKNCAQMHKNICSNNCHGYRAARVVDCSKNTVSLNVCENEGRNVPPLSLLLMATTTVNAQDYFNNERLEFIGDAFLAFSISAELFLHHKFSDEHVLSQNKSTIVSNLNLFHRSRKRHLWQYMVETKFDFNLNSMIHKLYNIGLPKEFDAKFHNQASRTRVAMEGKKMPSHDSDVKCDVVVGNKLLSDCLEALIGLFYIYNGEDVALDLMTWFDFRLCCIRNQKNFTCHHFKDFSKKEYKGITPKLGPSLTNSGLPSEGNNCIQVHSQTASSPQSHIQLGVDKGDNVGYDRSMHISKDFEMIIKSSMDYKSGIPAYVSKQLSDFEKILDYEFKDRMILLEALMHPSYICKFIPRVNSNQRLEFLGDSIVYLLITDYLCRKYPYATNAELTNMRCIVVNTKSMAKIAYLNHFHKFLFSLSTALSESIFIWSKFIEKEKMQGNLWPKVSLFI